MKLLPQVHTAIRLWAFAVFSASAHLCECLGMRKSRFIAMCFCLVS